MCFLDVDLFFVPQIEKCPQYKAKMKKETKGKTKEITGLVLIKMNSYTGLEFVLYQLDEHRYL